MSAAILRPVDAPRLERESVGCGEATSQKFHDSSFFFRASFSYAKRCEDFSHRSATEAM